MGVAAALMLHLNCKSASDRSTKSTPRTGIREGQGQMVWQYGITANDIPTYLAIYQQIKNNRSLHHSNSIPTTTMHREVRAPKATPLDRLIGAAAAFEGLTLALDAEGVPDFVVDCDFERPPALFVLVGDDEPVGVTDGPAVLFDEVSM